MTAPSSTDGDFKMAGAYVELTVKDNTQAGVDEAKSRIEGTAPVEVPAVITAPDESALTDFQPETVEVPTEATNPIDEEWLAKVNAAVAGAETDPVSVSVDYSDAAAQIEAFEREIDGKSLDVPVVAENPITAAWAAQVNSDLQSVAKQALQIPVDADTAPFREQLAAQLAELADLKENIPLDIANADAFRLEVTEQVAAISQSVRAVITMDIDGASLDDVRTKVLAAADASAQEVKAQQDLADAMQKGNATEIAKAQQALAEAETEARVAAEEQATAMEAMTAAEAAAGDGAEAASVGFRSLDAAMGPMWAVMNVAQIAMFAFGGSSDSTAKSAQDLTSSLVSLGQSGNTSLSSLAGNADLSKVAQGLTEAGSSTVQFSQAYSGSLQQATLYTNNLEAAQTKLGDTMENFGVVTHTQQGYAGDYSESVNTTTKSVKELSDSVANGSVALDSLTPAQQSAVNNYNDVTAAVKAAQKALDDKKVSDEAERADLAQQGIVISQTQQSWNTLGQAVANSAAEFNDQTSGIKSLTDNLLAADQANDQAQQSQQALAQAVTTTEQAYEQAEHGIVAAQQGVQAAIQGVQSAEYGVTTAEQGYNNALQQQVQAQQAVSAALKQARQDLANLELAANDAAAGTLNAGVNLFDAQTSAATLGVTAANAHSIAGQQVTATNEAQVKAAIALIEAQNQVADSQNSAAQAQDSLNTAQAEGINGNAAVVAANQQLVSSSQQVATAQHGVETAQLAVQTASVALQNAQYAVSQAQQAAKDAAVAHTQAVDANSHSVTMGTAVGDTNVAMLENLFEKNLTATGSVDQATAATEQEGEKMGFAQGAIDGVIGSITKIPPTTDFDIVGTPSLNLNTLILQANAEGISPSALGLTGNQLGLANALLEAPGHAEGGLISGQGTPTSDSNIIAVSDKEYIVNAASTAKHLPLIEAINNDEVPGFASGGQFSAQQAMGINYHLAIWDALLQGGSYGLQSMGASTPNLPADTGKVDFGTFANPGNAGSSGGQISWNGPAGVAQWSSQILQALASLGQPSSWLDTVERRMNQESGGNPTVVNKWDSNWAKGTPSVGLMQVIGPTFRSYAGPFANTGPFEYGTSVDPEANIYAGLNYALHRYGSLSALNRPGGYDSGGYALPGITPVVNGTGRPEMLLPPSMSDTLERIDAGVQSGGSSNAPPEMHIHNTTVVQDNDSAQLVAAKVTANTAWVMRSMRSG